MKSFEDLVTRRLAKSKLKSIPLVKFTLLQQFERRVLPGTAEVEGDGYETRLRIVPEGMESVLKGVKNDKTANVVNREMIFTSRVSHSPPSFVPVTDEPDSPCLSTVTSL